MNPPQLPSSVNVSHSILASEATTIYITQGRTRFSVVDQGAGVVGPQQVIEWLHTLALSPQAAFQLAVSLSTILQDYAARYGAIPQDKAFVARIVGRGEGDLQ